MILKIQTPAQYQKHFIDQLLWKLGRERSEILIASTKSFFTNSEAAKQYSGWVEAFNKMYEYLETYPKTLELDLSNLSSYHKDLLYTLINNLMKKYQQWTAEDIEKEDEPDIELLQLQTIIEDLNRSLFRINGLTWLGRHL